MKIKRATIVVSAVSALVTLGGPALAYTQSTWAPSSNPLIVKDDGTTRGSGYGVWNLVQTSNGLRSHGKAALKDARPGGDGIYGEMMTQSNSGICISPEYTSCNASWYNYKSDQTSRWYQNYYSTYQLMSTDVDGSGSYARAKVKVCEDQSWSGDPCTGYAYSKGNKY